MIGDFYDFYFRGFDGETSYSPKFKSQRFHHRKQTRITVYIVVFHAAD
jgi:hypothetical protein